MKYKVKIFFNFTHSNGDMCKLIFYKNRKYHRLNGPAIEYVDGDSMWFKDGLFHRTNGPAIEWADNAKEWWVEGDEYSERKFKKIVKKIK